MKGKTSQDVSGYVSTHEEDKRKAEQTADSSLTCKAFLSQWQTCRHMPVGCDANFSTVGTALVKLCRFKEL